MSKEADEKERVGKEWRLLRIRYNARRRRKKIERGQVIAFKKMKDRRYIG